MNGIEGAEQEYRELVSEGWTISFVVAEFEAGELVTMAQCYLNLVKVQLKTGRAASDDHAVPKSWPLDHESRWSPSPIAKANVAKAAALLALEWDRLHATRP